MSPKRFVDHFLVFSIVAFTSIAAMNFIVNPYAQYPSTVVEPLVQTSRATKTAYLANHVEPPEGLVLGSSRVLKYEPSYLADRFGHQKFFNAGINYAKPEDNLAMLRFYRERFHALPKTVVIGLDVHGFNESLPIDARLLNNKSLVRQIRDIVPLKQRFQSLKDLVSWKQSTDSVKSLVHSCCSKEREQKESFRFDGLIVYHQREQQLADGCYDFDSALEYSKREYKHLFAGYEKLSRERQEYFLQAIDICREGNARVVVFVTPMHPELKEYLAQTTTYPKRHDELVDFLVSQSQRRDFTFCDMSDLKTFDGRKEQFVDGIHPLEANTRLVIDRLVNLSRIESTYAVQ